MHSQSYLCFHLVLIKSLKIASNTNRSVIRSVPHVTSSGGKFQVYLRLILFGRFWRSAICISVSKLQIQFIHVLRCLDWIYFAILVKIAEVWPRWKAGLSCALGDPLSEADKLDRRERHLAWEHKGDETSHGGEDTVSSKKKLGKGSYCQAESGRSGMEVGAGAWWWAWGVRIDAGGEVKTENEVD